MGLSGPILRVVEVSKIFTTPAEEIAAVNAVSLDVMAGEFVVIHGASGCGKSTLLALLAALTTPDSGSVTINETPVSELSEDDRSRWRLDRIGVIFQQDNLIDEFTCAENIGFPLELLGKSDVAAAVKRQLERVDLAGYEERWPRELSGGQQQRIGIARALVGQREVLIADEPTAALDSKNSLAIFSLLRELSDSGVTIVLASHDPRVRDYATRVIEMGDGRLGV